MGFEIIKILVSTTWCSRLIGIRVIVAVARWQFPYSLNAEQKAEKEELQKVAPAKPEGYKKELGEELSKAMDKGQEKWVDDSKDYGNSKLS